MKEKLEGKNREKQESANPAHLILPTLGSSVKSENTIAKYENILIPASFTNSKAF